MLRLATWIEPLGKGIDFGLVGHELRLRHWSSVTGNGQIEIQFRHGIDGLPPSDRASPIWIVDVRRLGVNQFIAHSNNAHVGKIDDSVPAGVASRVMMRLHGHIAKANDVIFRVRNTGGAGFPAFEVYVSRFFARFSCAMTWVPAALKNCVLPL